MLSEFDNCLREDDIVMSMAKKVRKCDDKDIIYVKEIIEQCVFLEFDNNVSYIVHYPNIIGI